MCGTRRRRRAGRLLQGASFHSVVVLPSNSEDAAATVDRDPGVGEAVDHREEPFGRGRSSSRNFAACRTISSSVSSSRMRPFAARSSADSEDGTPGRRPWSMSSWRIQFDSGLLGLLAGTHERDSAGTELRRIGAGHGDEPSGSGHQLATETGTLPWGRSNWNPFRSSRPNPSKSKGSTPELRRVTAGTSGTSSDRSTSRRLSPDNGSVSTRMAESRSATGPILLDSRGTSSCRALAAPSKRRLTGSALSVSGVGGLVREETSGLRSVWCFHLDLVVARLEGLL